MTSSFIHYHSRLAVVLLACAQAVWAQAETLGSAPVKTKWMRLPGTVQHGFTHFRLDLTILAGTTDNPPDGIWARPDQFKDHAFPTLTKKVARHALSVLPPEFFLDP